MAVNILLRSILNDSDVVISRCFVSCYRVKHSVRHQHSSSKYILKSSYPDIVLPDVPLHHYIWQNIHKWPNHIAIECGISGKKYSYNELYMKCRRFGSSLKKLGLKRGEMLSLLLPNTPDFPIAYLGALEAGLIATTINPNYTKDEVVYQLQDANSEWIICHPVNIKVALEARKHLKNKLNIICTHNIDGSQPNSPDNVILFEDTINDSIKVPDLTDEDTNLSETALIAYSSGTTGLPKGTCLTHFSITANLAQLDSDEVDKYQETTGNHQNVIPAVLPFFHCYGNVVILLQSLEKGARIVTLPKFDPKQFINVLERNSNILLFLAPPVIFFLGNSTDVTFKHLQGVREVMCGAAPCSANDIAKVKQKAPQLLYSQGYGMTEASPVITVYQPEGKDTDNISTVGKLVSSTWGKVISCETGEPLPPNMPGELCTKGPQLMKCYLNNPKATAETIDSDGWLHTGDVGHYDEDGYFYVTDRLKELIKVKGFQVAPAELEGVLRRHPGVLEAGVVGAPCEKSGETPVAFIQTKPGVEITEDEIKNFVSSQLSKHKQISSVRFVQTIPISISGKILRKELKKLL